MSKSELSTLAQADVAEPVFDRDARAAEKPTSRDEDARALASGEKSREQLGKENTFLPANRTKIDFRRILILR